jgi:hypothetical protein
MNTATFLKLASGDWGIRGTGPVPAPGASVTVSKRTGERRTLRVGKIVWQGNSGVWLSTIQPKAPRKGAPVPVSNETEVESYTESDPAACY